MYMRVYACVFMTDTSMCVCVKKKNRERDGDKERSIGNERVCMRVSWWVAYGCARLCERERQ